MEATNSKIFYPDQKKKWSTRLRFHRLKIKVMKVTLNLMEKIK
jgi:hypothetical protein